MQFPAPLMRGFLCLSFFEETLMPYRSIIRSVKKIYEGGKSTPTKTAAKETMSPRQQRRAEPVPGKPSTSSRAKANQAADMLRVPGRNVVRGAMARRKQMLDDL
jgi:hypothetical protein